MIILHEMLDFVNARASSDVPGFEHRCDNISPASEQDA